MKYVAVPEADLEQLKRFARLLAKPAEWIGDEVEDDAYLGTQLCGVDNDVTPTVGECREAAAFLKRIGDEG